MQHQERGPCQETKPMKTSTQSLPVQGLRYFRTALNRIQQVVLGSRVTLGRHQLSDGWKKRPSRRLLGSGNAVRRITPLSYIRAR